MKRVYTYMFEKRCIHMKRNPLILHAQRADSTEAYYVSGSLFIYVGLLMYMFEYIGLLKNTTNISVDLVFRSLSSDSTEAFDVSGSYI